MCREIHSPNPEPPVQNAQIRRGSYFWQLGFGTLWDTYIHTYSALPPPCNSFLLYCVNSPKRFRCPSAVSPHSAVRHLHAQIADGILAELTYIHIHTFNTCHPINASLPHLVYSSRESGGAEQLAGNADSDLAISGSKLHLKGRHIRSGQVSVRHERDTYSSYTVTAFVMRLRMTCSIL